MKVKNEIIFFSYLTIIFAILTAEKLWAIADPVWELIYQPRQRLVKSIESIKGKLFIGTGNGILTSINEGKTWEDFGSNQLQKDSSGNSLVNWIHIDKGRIYIATSFGAYYSEINNPNWHKIFENTKAGTRKIDTTTEDIDLSGGESDLSTLGYEDDFSLTGQVNSISADNEQIYLSTNDGFWICDLNSGNKCKRLNEGLEPDFESGNYEVLYSLKVSNDLFLATSNGIYTFDNENLRWNSISGNIQKLENGNINARYLFLDKKENLWALCGTGIYLSSNKGKTWEKVTNGIKKNDNGFQEAYFLLEENQKLYAACASGVYYLDNEHDFWQSISDGIRTKESSKNVYWLTKLNNNLYAATDEGLFVANDTTKTINESLATDSKLILKGKVETDFGTLESLEPSVVEVQKQALRFASLPTQADYKRYRAQARLRNLIPRVGFDINRTGTTTNYSQFQNGISTNTSLDNSYSGDNTRRFQYDGKSYKQLSVQWDTNQFVYDDEIWRILNQARLTANIKENLLDDVTRIFYQRKRLQLQNLLSRPEDTTNKISSELEIAELTGQIDSRTGGWFSSEIERRKVNGIKK